MLLYRRRNTTFLRRLALSRKTVARVAAMTQFPVFNRKVDILIAALWESEGDTLQLEKVISENCEAILTLMLLLMRRLDAAWNRDLVILSQDKVFFPLCVMATESGLVW